VRHFHCHHLRVNWPLPLDTVTALRYATGDNNYLIVVHGKSHLKPREPKKPVACLVEHTTGAVTKGELTKDGMHWVFLFKGLPRPEIHQSGHSGTRYHLFVGLTDANENTSNHGMAVDLFIERSALDAKADEAADAAPNAAAAQAAAAAVLAAGAAASVAHGFTRGNIPIQYPPTDTTAGASFMAYGSDGPNGSPDHAAMQLGGGNVAVGVKVNTGVNGSWVFQFTDVPDNNGYTFVVSKTAPADSGSTVRITINSADNPPVAAPPPPPPSPPQT
jgi:hypothetical protein